MAVLHPAELPGPALRRKTNLTVLVGSATWWRGCDVSRINSCWRSRFLEGGDYSPGARTVDLNWSVGRYARLQKCPQERTTVRGRCWRMRSWLELEVEEEVVVVVVVEDARARVGQLCLLLSVCQRLDQKKGRMGLNGKGQAH
jgi:hypothetical protein